MSRIDILQRVAKGELSAEQADGLLDEWEHVLEQVKRSIKQVTVEVKVYRWGEAGMTLGLILV